VKIQFKLLEIQSSSGNASDKSQIILSVVFRIFILLEVRSANNNSSVSVDDGISLDHKVLRK
jgi:hypothetical protein